MSTDDIQSVEVEVTPHQFSIEGVISPETHKGGFKFTCETCDYSAEFYTTQFLESLVYLAKTHTESAWVGDLVRKVREL